MQKFRTRAQRARQGPEEYAKLPDPAPSADLWGLREVRRQGVPRESTWQLLQAFPSAHVGRKSLTRLHPRDTHLEGLGATESAAASTPHLPAHPEPQAGSTLPHRPRHALRTKSHMLTSLQNPTVVFKTVSGKKKRENWSFGHLRA